MSKYWNIIEPSGHTGIGTNASGKSMGKSERGLGANDEDLNVIE